MRRALTCSLAALLSIAGTVAAVSWPRPSDSGQVAFAPTPSAGTPRATTTPEPAPTSTRASRAGELDRIRPGATCGARGARIVTFRVYVDDGLDTTKRAFTQDLMSVLCDERSWIGSGRVRFRYDTTGDLLIGLYTAANKNRICSPYTGNPNGYFSCYVPNHVVLNADRWFGGSRYWDGSVRAYRRLLINHEVGHALGQSHRGCPKHGARAPAMMQQSMSLTTAGRTCRPNAWPRAYELRSVR